MVGSCFSYLLIFYQALSCVLIKALCIKLNLKGKWFNANDFDRFSVINFRHSFYFNELYIVTFLVGVTLIFVNSDSCLFVICYRSNNERFNLFTVSISDQMLVTEVEEGITCRSQVLRENESNLVGVAESIDSH